MSISAHGPRRGRAGFTLIEMAVAVGVFALVGVIACNVWIAAIRSFDVTASRTVADTDAVICMQRMIADVREAKSVQWVTSNHIRLIFPVKNADGSYNRLVSDTANPVDYLQSDSSGADGHAGTWLWRRDASGTSRPLARDVHSLEFQIDDPTHPTSVRITVTTRTNYAGGEAETSLTERVVYLRNY